MYERILLVSYLSEQTRLTFKPVAALAQACGAKVVIFHALHGSSELFYLEEEVRSIIDRQALERARPKLEAFASELRSHGVEVEILTRVGSTFDLAVRLIEELKIDLVVVPTEGYAEFTGRVIGSATARIIRDTNVPVLAINESFKTRVDSWAGFRRIICPIDFFEDWQTTLKRAEEFAVEFGGRVEVVNVVQPISQQVMETPEGDLVLPKDMQYQIKSKLQARLSDAAHTITQVPAAWMLIEDNKPGSGVMTYADRHDVDLIIVSGMGRDTTRHTVLGSMSEHVIKHARCPVLTLRGAFEG
jgi:nucleotide-binding universal stress UspA family protein